MPARVLVIDNYDSFTYNLVQYLGELEAELVVVRNDAISLTDAAKMGPTHVVISPGPGRPQQAGISLEVIRHFSGQGTPTLGVCLGHQAIAVALGGSIRRSSVPVHGKTSKVFHDGSRLYAGIPSPFTAGRYHSLEVSPELPQSLRISARTGDGTVMGIRHKVLPLQGVQFHPESILTGDGKAILANFLALAEGGEKSAEGCHSETHAG